MKNNFRLLAVFALFASVNLSFAQNFDKGKISTSVFLDNNMPADVATAALLRAKDSAIVKAAIPDKTGLLEFENLKSGAYLLKISLLGYQNHFTPVSVDANTPSVFLPKILLKANDKTLNAVTVTAQKPFIERKLDRLVVNVENSVVSAGSTVLEVLERSPNVMVNQESSINLKGRSGVIVMLDGKPTPLSGSDLINYLKSLPSSTVEKIEIISNPSAKYDAAGNAGIIDIKFKKDKRLGTNGSLTLGVGQGVYNRLNGSANVNYRTKKVNVFGAYSLGDLTTFTKFDINRQFFDSLRRTTAVFDQKSFIKQPIQTHTARLGLDYFLSKKTVVGFLLTGNLQGSDRNGFTNSLITNPRGELQYTTETNQALTSKNFNGFGNINLKHTFDSTGRELTVDADLGQYDAATFQNFTNNNLNPVRALLSKNTLETDQNGIISVKSVKADYVQPMKNKNKLEAGLKSSFVKTDNDIQFFDVVDGKKTLDKRNSNHFIYAENVNAAYLNYAQEFDKFDVQFGLRAEHTRTDGEQVTTGDKFNRDYVSLFPSLAMNRKVSANHQVGLTYSRRIDRPNYRQLNPFRIFVDPYTYVVGDPQLKPVFTNSFEVSHTFKGRYVTELSFAKSQNTITDVFVQDDVTKISNQIPANLQDLVAVSLSVAVPFSIKKWLNSNVDASVFWNKYDSPFLGGQLVNQSVSWTARMQNSIVLGKKGWSAEVTGFYNSELVWGLFTVGDYSQISAGIQKVSKDKNSTFRLNVSDIFYNNHISVVVKYQNMDFFTDRTWDSRVASFSWTYRFGKNTVQQARRRSTGVEDEKRRAG